MKIRDINRMWQVIMKPVYAAFFVALAIFFTTAELRAEYVFLKDGSIIKGAIVSETSGAVVIMGEDRKKQTIKRENIMRVLYTELNMGKIWVQKKSGEGFIAYMVDEDRESYTFRVDLYKPAEFKLSRAEVLFISERTCSGLKGEATTDSIELTWYPPYDTMEEYRIYVKKKKEDRYELLGKSDTTSYNVEELPSNTKYFFMVTGVDAKNEETPPSNELEITTKNILPTEPGGVSLDKNDKGDTVVTWKPGTDKDGKVVSYKIYALVDKSKNLIGETKELTYTIKAGTAYDKIIVRSVDNMGGESGMEVFRKQEKPTLMVSLYPGFIYPVLNFGDLSGSGYGATAAFTWENYIFTGFTAGIEAGCYYLTGKDELDNMNRKTESALFAPAMITLGYRVYYSESLIITPFVSCGAVYFNSKNVERDNETLVETGSTISEVGPAAVAGMGFAYRLGDSLYLSLRGACGYMIGAEKGVYVVADLGFMYRL